MGDDWSHFEGQTAAEHVHGKHADGIALFAEEHGLEMPSHLASMADAGRETAIVVLLIWSTFHFYHLPHPFAGIVLFPFVFGWIAWKAGRAAWLGWFRLERLHRLIEQEKYEIEHHREQEREELVVLYKEKGFSGKLLEDVVDVLMADGDRLLKVMVEEELGLSLGQFEHPIKQGIGAFVGAAFTVLITSICFFLLPDWTMWLGTFGVLGGGAALSAALQKNRTLPAMIWNLALGGLAVGLVFSFAQLVFPANG